MIELKNEQLSVTVNPRGAELTRIYGVQSGLEYLWDANPEYWAKHAPILFPIVGALKDNSYYYQGAAYSMHRHGFARDMDFTTEAATDTSTSFRLEASQETLDRFPFRFSLLISYRLEGQKLSIRYEVTNPDNKNLLFSIGGHPAFRVPLIKGHQYEDYFLEFEHPETISRWPLEDGLLKTHAQPLLANQQSIRLTRDLFRSDAIVLKHVQSRSISLKSRSTRHGITVRIDEFPYLGLWAPPEAPFVCIEPWHGLADSLHHNQQLEEKEGIITLGPGKSWSASWDMSFF